MDENEVIKEIEHDDNCFWSYVGSFIGGLVGTIPWILLSIPILSALIPIMAVAGYKFFKGVVNKKTFRTILIISIAIFVLTLTLLLPFYLAQKDGMTLDEFKQSDSYPDYINRIIQFVGTETFSLMVGLAIGYRQIQNLLNRYKSTNNMIKDMNTFIRKDNDPIDEEGYTNGGIRFTDKNESPITSNDIIDDLNNYSPSKQSTISNNVWDNKDTKNYSQMTMTREQQRVLKLFLIIFFGFPFISFILFGIIAAVLEGVTNSSSNNTDTYNYTYDYNYDYDSDYSNVNETNDNYIFENQNIEISIPDGWNIIAEYDGYLYLEDEYGYDKIVAVFKAEEGDEDLKEIHTQIVELNTLSEDEFYPIYAPIKGNSAYYSVVNLDNGYFSIVYTMKYEDNYIIVFDEQTKFYSFSDYDTILNSVKEIYK